MDFSGGNPYFNFNQHVTQRYNISQWHDAFLQYATCIAQQHLMQSADIFSYMHSIEEMGTGFRGFAWYSYECGVLTA